MFQNPRLARLVGAISTLLGLTAAGAARADEPCALTPECISDGRCTQVGAACSVASDADCLQGSACQTGGACSFDPAQKACVAKDCAKTPACKATGACALVEGACHGTDDGCAASRDCKAKGYCAPDTRGTAGVCMPTSDADCAGAIDCKEAGACTLQGGDFTSDCVATTTKECMDSAECRSWGLCQAIPGGGCQATAASCKRSTDCKTNGNCDRDPNGACLPLTDASCAGSEACTKNKACAAWQGLCVNAPADALSAPACDEVEVTVKITASSAHKASPPYTFEATNLVDRDLRTSWQPSDGKGGVGQTLTLELPAEARLARLGVANGFQLRDKLGDLFAMNSRLDRIAIRAGGAVVVAGLGYKDAGFVSIALPHVKAHTIDLEVLGSLKGWRWNDLAVSELRVFVCK